MKSYNGKPKRKSYFKHNIVYCKKGDIVVTYPNVLVAEKETGVYSDRIYKCCNGKNRYNNKKCNTYMETSVNNKCRAFTSLEQSKKLAEILPIESADMEWVIDGLGEPFPFPIENKVGTDEQPCWSLTALLNTLPQTVRLVGTSKDSYWYCECVNGNNQSYAGFGSADNPIDACVEMILKLDKLKML